MTAMRAYAMQPDPLYDAYMAAAARFRDDPCPTTAQLVMSAFAAWVREFSPGEASQLIVEMGERLHTIRGAAHAA